MFFLVMQQYRVGFCHKSDGENGAQNVQNSVHGYWHVFDHDMGNHHDEKGSQAKNPAVNMHTVLFQPGQ